ncbi:hypothetical protein AAF712_015460 [Marasmius tenuissimus]|uniref:Uncharacterized protein n=1 Tax=Marasmius tenuissimus TaxID=585030 RepID=A0ABR2ZAS4_9AGAR
MYASPPQLTDARQPPPQDGNFKPSDDNTQTITNGSDNEQGIFHGSRNTQGITGNRNRQCITGANKNRQNVGNPQPYPEYRGSAQEYRTNPQTTPWADQDDMYTGDGSSAGCIDWTRRMQENGHYYCPQEEQGRHSTHNQRYSASPRPGQLLLEAAHNGSPEDRVDSDRIMALVGGPRHEPVAIHTNEARRAPRFAQSQVIPGQEDAPPARYGATAREQAQVREEEEGASRPNGEHERNVVQPRPVRAAQDRNQDWEQEKDQDTPSLLEGEPNHIRAEPVTPHRASSESSRTESAEQTLARTPLVSPLPPPSQISRPNGAEDDVNIRRDSRPAGAPLMGRIESIGHSMSRISSGKQESSIKTESEDEEGKRGKSWKRRLFNWKKEDKDKDVKRRV